MLNVSDMHDLTKRAQCRANIEALLASMGAPSLVVKDVQVDRVFVEMSPEFLKWVAESVDESGRPRFNADKPNTKLHPGAVAGWREDVTFCSLQVCQLEDSLEIDIDLGGTRTDVVGAITHFAEVVRPGKTNHLQVREMLSKHRDLEVGEATNEQILALMTPSQRREYEVA